MINGETVMVGIVTYNRPQQFSKLLSSLLLRFNIDRLSVVNDGSDQGYVINNRIDSYRLTEGKIGVGKCKNILIQEFIDKDYDHLFLIEDDIFIKDTTVFEKYIQASKLSGIQHFNFSQHGMMNKKWNFGKSEGANVEIELALNDRGDSIQFFRHCVGAFSYYSKICIDKVGLICDEYYNACEHVDHTYQIIKAGMHPSFWYFADIANSQDYLGDEEWSLQQSTISSDPNHRQIVSKADEIFIKRNGLLPGNIPLVGLSEFMDSLKQIKKKYVQ